MNHVAISYQQPWNNRDVDYVLEMCKLLTCLDILSLCCKFCVGRSKDKYKAYKIHLGHISNIIILNNIVIVQHLWWDLCNSFFLIWVAHFLLSTFQNEVSYEDFRFKMFLSVKACNKVFY